MSFTLQGAIKGKYDGLAPTFKATLGALTSYEYDIHGILGGRVSDFQFGSIYWSAATGPHVVAHGIWGKYNSLNPTFKISLGMPTSDEHDLEGVPGGRVNDFQFGSIYWSAATGSHVVAHGIWQKYTGLSLADRKHLGMPTSDEQGPPTGRVNTFQGGSITWSSAGGSIVYLNPTPPPLVRPPHIPPLPLPAPILHLPSYF